MAAVLVAVLAVALLAALAAAEALATEKGHYSAAAAAEVVLDLGPAADAVEAWKVGPCLAEAFQADLAAAMTDHLYVAAVEAELAVAAYPVSLAVLVMALAA